MFDRLKVLGLSAAVILALTMPVEIFAKDKDRDFHHGAALDARQHGLEHGYRDGLHEGAKDRDHRDKHHADAKDADKGYEKYMGDKARYKDGYNEGFRAGYDDGFYGRPSRLGQVFGPNDDRYRIRGESDGYDDIYANRRWAANDVATDIGRRDGLAAGIDDFRRGHRSSPEDARDYRNADHGYRPNYGDQDTYRRLYRDAFVQGYRDGYNRMP